MARLQAMRGAIRGALRGAMRALVLGAALTFGAAVLPIDQLAAQETGQAWIQLEAIPDLTTAEERARAYAADLGGVSGFRIGSKWYLLALGPFGATEAAGKMAALKASGQIPRDAYISDGADHGAQFWPVGAAAADPAAAEPAAESAAEPAAETATQTVAAPPAAPTDETQDQALASEADLPRDAKAELQTALQWYGHYEGKLDGSIGRGTRGSMAAWQTAMGFDPTGVLTTLQRETLVTNYRADEAAFGFAPTTEPEAGIEFSLPANLLAFDHYEPPFVHFAAKDGSTLRLLLISEPGDDSTLAGLYDLLQTLEVVPSAGERALADGRFTINGASAAQGAFATAAASKGAVKGYLLVWDAAQADLAQRILATLQATFRSTGDQVLDPGLVPLDEGVKAGVLAGMAVKTPKASASGTFVDAAGMVLTASAAVAECGKITLDGTVEAEIAASDAALGVAVLRPLSKLAPLAFGQPAAQPAPVGTAVLLAGYSIAAGLPAPVLTQGRLEAQSGPDGAADLLTLSAHVTPHDLGGPVLDGSGALLGVILGVEAGGKTLPEGLSLARSAASLAALLQDAGVPTADAAAEAAPETAAPARLTPDALNAAASGMTVQVACWP